MAVVFTVETGAIITGANSYLTLAEASDYFSIDPLATDWEALTQANKEARLMWAARYLDQKTSWRGYVKDDTQPMRWPRTCVYNADGTLIPDNVVPAQVKAAVCELAKFMLTTDPTVGTDIDEIARIVVDVIEIEYQPGTSQNRLPSMVQHILYPLGTFNTGSRGFGRIVRI